MNAMTPVPKVDISVLIAKYIELRDKIKKIKDKHKEELQPYNDAKERLEAIFMDHLNQAGTDSAAAKGVGTIYRSTKRSATVADGEEFRKFIVSGALWDLVDIKANAPAIADFIETNGGPPPGVNFSQSTEIGVRRS